MLRSILIAVLAFLPGALVIIAPRQAQADPPQGDTPRCQVKIDSHSCPSNPPPASPGCYKCNSGGDCIYNRTDVYDYPGCAGYKVTISAVIADGPCPDDCGYGPQQ